jgi:hypothetical protein
MPLGYENLMRFHRGEMVETTTARFSFSELGQREDFWHGDVVSLCTDADQHQRRFYRAPRRRILPQFGASFMLIVAGRDRPTWVYLDRGDQECDLVTGENVSQLLIERTLTTTDLTQELAVGDVFRYYWRRGTTPETPISIGMVSPVRSFIFSPARSLREKEDIRAEINTLRGTPKRLQQLYDRRARM